MFFTLLLSIIWIMGVDCGTQKSQFLKYHNYYRSKETQAINMKKMHWDDEIASKASLFAKQCVVAHSPRQSRKTSKYSYLGENLYFTTGSSVNAKKAVKTWYAEKQYYNFTDNSCKSKKVCGHYTQVVWAESKALGCSAKACPSIKISLNGRSTARKEPVNLVICLYGPGGNYKGVRPYKIKQVGNDNLDSSDRTNRTMSSLTGTNDSVQTDSPAYQQNEDGIHVETRLSMHTETSSDFDD